MFNQNKDINLLYSMTQASKKKSTSNIAVVLAVLALAIIGLMIFLFATAKVDIANNQQLLDELNDKLSQQDELTALQNRYNKLKTEYQNAIADMVAKLYPDMNATTYGKMSSTFIAVIFDYVETTVGTRTVTTTTTDADGNEVTKTEEVDAPDVIINSLTVSGNSVNMACSVREFEAAWAFVDYLEGIAVDTTRPGIENNGDVIAAFEAQLEKNSAMFSGVMAEYPGLPAEDENGDYTVDFTLKFTVDWMEVAA